MEITGLTVDHHVDEKYGELAFDSVKKLQREREIEKMNKCFSSAVFQRRRRMQGH